MTRATDVATKCGIAYFLTPENTTEMHGSDRQIEAFAEAIRVEERETCASDKAKEVERILDGIEDCPGLTIEQDLWLSRMVRSNARHNRPSEAKVRVDGVVRCKQEEQK